MAAALLKQELADHNWVEVGSAGTQAEAGLRPPASLREAVKRMGIDLQRHRSRPLTMELVAQADLVLTMSGALRSEAQKLQPSAVPKVFTLPEFLQLISPLKRDPAVRSFNDLVLQAHRLRPVTEVKDDEIEDPAGAGQASYERVGKRLTELTRSLARAISSVKAG